MKIFSVICILVLQFQCYYTPMGGSSVGTLYCQGHVEDIPTFDRVARSEFGYKH